CTELWRFG
nr:immunoglobulin heavy chain junction region [Mus musculus]MBK4197649.1 immunoglobulin heavy chain junction region [Mus musculus]MBK4197650.1 immunoglobulin heavy chain junction region [Mus musculus]